MNYTGANEKSWEDQVIRKEFYDSIYGHIFLAVCCSKCNTQQGSCECADQRYKAPERVETVFTNYATSFAIEQYASIHDLDLKTIAFPKKEWVERLFTDLDHARQAPRAAYVLYSVYMEIQDKSTSGRRLKWKKAKTYTKRDKFSKFVALDFTLPPLEFFLQFSLDELQSIGI